MWLSLCICLSSLLKNCPVLRQIKPSTSFASSTSQRAPVVFGTEPHNRHLSYVWCQFLPFLVKGQIEGQFLQAGCKQRAKCAGFFFPLWSWLDNERFDPQTTFRFYKFIELFTTTQGSHTIQHSGGSIYIQNVLHGGSHYICCRYSQGIRK